MMRKIGTKKAAAILTGMLLTLSLAACGSQNGGNEARQDRENLPVESTREPSAPRDEEDAVNQTEQTAENSPEVFTEEPAGDAGGSSAEGGRTLVVYYSATGHTERVAGIIAEATDADVFVLEPVEPYSSDDLDWTDENSRVVYEHDNPDARNVELAATTVDAWESYDTVFIGYPIWWHIAAWPVDGFIAANDFTGKTVIPFCTSSSSDLGESGELLAEAAGTGNWLEGMRFASSASEVTVQAWVESLELQAE